MSSKVGEEADPENQLMVGESFARSMEIDPRKARFPCSIVWSPLPVISWFIPFIGHIGICREDGVILDFAGPNFVCVDNFTFGAATRYIPINKAKECCISSHRNTFRGEDEFKLDDRATYPSTWDDALRKSTQEFQHKAYNLFTCNCHSFVANSLNKLRFRSGGWNVVNLATFIFFKGSWVDKASVLKSLLPFVIVSGLGLAFGGMTFLTFLAIFAFLLVGWFLLGTYCFKKLIQL